MCALVAVAKLDPMKSRLPNPTMRYDGTDVRVVSTSPTFGYRPDWGPAGRQHVD